MTDVKISADLSDAIERLSEKLGLAADAIIPQYTKNIFVNGIGWILGGIAMIVLPWVIFYPPVPVGFEGYDAELGEVLLIGLKWGLILGGTWGGAYCVLDNLRKAITPKAEAISHLLNQIT